MKKLFYAIAALAVVASCAKVAEVETNVEPKEENNLVHMTIRAEAPQTKTFIDQTGAKTYQPGWNQGDQLAVFFDAVKDNKDAVLDNSGDTGKAAEFNGNVTIANGPHTVYGFYPATTVFKKGDSDTKVQLQVASIQRPLAYTFDPDADIAVGKALGINVTSSDVTINNMVFARLLSTVKVTITESNDKIAPGEKINAITICSSESNLTGVIEWDYDTQLATAVSDDNTVTADLSADPIAFGTPIFVLVNPTTMSAGSSLIITVSTDSHEITKTISLSGAINFPLGGIAELKINLDNNSNVAVGDPISEPAGIGWYLVKKAQWLHPGDEVVIVAGEHDFALSTTQQNKYRESTAVTISEGILTITDDVQRFALEVGTVANTFAFKGINGSYANYYIYAASSSDNILKSQSTKDDNASFDLDISSDGEAIALAMGEYNHNILRYNSSNPRFCCYGSSSSITENVRIFKNFTTPALETPANLEAVAVGDDVMVSWDAVTGADSYTVTCDENVRAGVTENNYTFENLADGTYTVTVKAISNDHSTMRDSGVASTTVIVGTPALGKPVISSFTETATGFDAVISAAVEYATSYDWDLYVDSVEIANWIGSGNTTDLSFSVAFAETDITEFTPGKTYYLVVTAKAAGYSDTESDPASFYVEPIVPESLPYNNTLISGHTGFTIQDVSTGSLTYIWSDTQYGVQANANTTTSDVETYLLSPYFDLSGVENAKLTFEHGVKFFKDIATAKTQTGLQVRIGTGAWENLTIPTYPAAQGNDAVSNEISLIDYAGSIIQLRFKYLATSSNPGRWQIKNLSVTEVLPPAHEITVNGEDSPLTVELNGNHTISTELTIASNYNWSVKSTTGLSTAYTYVKNSETLITVTPVSDNETGAKITGIGTMVLTDGTVDYTITFDQAQKVAAKEYTLTINTTDFNGTSYAANNNEKTTNAIASDESTLPVKWTSYQVMLQSGVMQWQKNNAYIYNSTDLGKIKSVTVTSSEGTFTTYYGTSAQPSSSTTPGDSDGFFKIKVGSATGKTSKVEVVFEK